MTVGELIEHLKRYDTDETIVINGSLIDDCFPIQINDVRRDFAYLAADQDNDHFCIHIFGETQ